MTAGTYLRGIAAPSAVVIALAGSALTPRGAGAALFTNGSFESPAVGPTADRIDVTAGSYITGSSGWQSVNFGTNTSNIAIYAHGGKNPWPVASDGIQLATLNSTGGSLKGGLQQSFDTITGKSYKLTFDYSAIGDATARPSVQATYEIYDGATSATAAGVAIAGGTATTSTVNSNLSFPAYKSYSLTFTALSGTSTVRFLSSQVPNGNAYGPVIDNVQIVEVPEPGTGAAVAGIAMLGLLRRRRSFKCAK